MQITYLKVLTIGLLLGVSCAKDEPKEPGPEQTPAFIANLAEMVNEMGHRDWHVEPNFSNITIAVLDNGFDGLEKKVGKTLPANTTLVAPATGDHSGSAHGTIMAETAMAIATGRYWFADLDEDALPWMVPNLRLYVTKGAYRNFEKATADLMAYKKSHPEQLVIAVYSHIWEWGGNGDGDGYINKLVNQATEAGVLWFNSSGNLGNSTYHSSVEKTEGGVIKLPIQDKLLPLTITEPDTQVKIVLGWADFTSDYEYATSQDMNLILEDAGGKELMRSDLVQDGRDRGITDGFSRHAREVIKGTINPGTYYLRAEQGPSGVAEGTKFWITVAGRGVVLPHSNGDEMVFMPADNPSVLTVGASDVDFSSLRLSAQVRKPELLCLSKVSYSDGSLYFGTSTANAVAAGFVAAYASKHRIMMSRQAVIAATESGEIAFESPASTAKKPMYHLGLTPPAR